MYCSDFNRERSKSLYNLSVIDPKFKLLSYNFNNNNNINKNGQTHSLNKSYIKNTIKNQPINTYNNYHGKFNNNIKSTIHINEINNKCSNCDKFINRYKCTLDILNKTRNELLSISNILVKKEYKIAFLENVACGSEIEINNNLESIKQLQVEIECLNEENKIGRQILKSQINSLDEQINEKDKTIMELKKALFENQTNLEIIKEKNTQLTNEVEIGSSQMDALVTSANNKYILLNEMEKNLIDTELYRQREYLEQIRINKNLELDFKFNHNLASNLLIKKSQNLDAVVNKLSKCQNGINKVVKAAMQIQQDDSKIDM